MQFGIFVFAEVQEINFRGNLLDSKCDGDYHKYYLIIQQYAALLKKPAIFLWKETQKSFLEVPKRIERLQQNTLVKLRFSDSDSEQV